MNCITIYAINILSAVIKNRNSPPHVTISRPEAYRRVQMPLLLLQKSSALRSDFKHHRPGDNRRLNRTTDFPSSHKGCYYQSRLHSFCSQTDCVAEFAKAWSVRFLSVMARSLTNLGVIKRRIQIKFQSKSSNSLGTERTGIL